MGPHPNEGARLFWVELCGKKETQSDATDRIGVKPGTVHHWLYGDRVPAAKHRIRIVELYGVPISAWDRPIPRKRFEVPASVQL